MYFLVQRFRIAVLTALLAFGLVSTAFGHHFASAQDQALVAFYQSVAASDDLCGDDLWGGKDSCNACRLVASYHLSDPVMSPVQENLRYVRQIFLRDLRRADALATFQRPPSRAPPRL